METLFVRYTNNLLPNKIKTMKMAVASRKPPSSHLVILFLFDQLSLEKEDRHTADRYKHHSGQCVQAHALT